MKTFRLIVMTLIAALFCVACSDGGKEPGGTDPVPTPPQAAIADFTQTNMNFTNEAGEQSFTFTANENWTITVAETKSTAWYTVSPTSGGKGKQTVKISTVENDSYDDRSVTITLKAGSESKSFVVSQKQKNALTVTSDKYEIGADGGTITIEVKANVDYKYEIEASAQSWITPASTRGLSTTTIQLNVAENEEDAKREGKITIKSGELSEVVTIYQEGAKPTIVLTKNEYVVASAGEDILVELRSNVDYKMVMPQGCDWITESETRAFSSHTHYFTVHPNTDYDSRTAEISFVNKENNLSETVSITQMQHNAILVAKNEYDFTCEGGALDFEVNTNVDFTVSVDVDWITEDKTRGLTAYPLHFKVAENTIEESREGIITITGGELKQTIKVKQQMFINMERQALIDLYNATDGDHWTNNTNWCSDKPLDEWFGITTKEGYVSQIALWNNNLSGSIPESIGEFKHLEYLCFGEDNLTGSIPESIGKLENLKKLLISASKELTGNIPESIGNLKNLELLELAGNNLTGNIPESLGNLSNVWSVYLANNQLTGQIPETLGNMEGLRDIILNGNLLTGQIPKTICSLKNIEELNFRYNQLTGQIPEEIGNLVSLRSLFLDYNQLTGPVPETVVNLKKLENLVLANNHLSGTIPAGLFQMPQLEYLDLWGNDFSGLEPESTDYTRDGEVLTLQKASVGKGIDLVFMGDIFIDKDMNPGGKYEQAMHDAMEQFFAYEPYKTFRNRFNVYAVKAVSPNSFMYEGANAFNNDDGKAMEYALKVPDLKKDDPLNIIVVCNQISQRSCYTCMYMDNSFVAWNYGGVSRVINHEAGGHGFAKLDDEYVKTGFENQTFTSYEGLDFDHKRNWGLNVDYHSTKNDILWSHFMNDSRYAGLVGIYEGALCYGRGAYRPTENSMMRYTDSPWFNAPSREAIYKAIMRASEGEDWKYDYEEFARYDEINRQEDAANTRSTTSSADIEKWKNNHRPPVIVKGTWRDAVNNKNQIIVPLR